MKERYAQLSFLLHCQIELSHEIAIFLISRRCVLLDFPNFLYILVHALFAFCENEKNAFFVETLIWREVRVIPFLKWPAAGFSGSSLHHFRPGTSGSSAQFPVGVGLDQRVQLYIFSANLSIFYFLLKGSVAWDFRALFFPRIHEFTAPRHLYWS